MKRKREKRAKATSKKAIPKTDETDGESIDRGTLARSHQAGRLWSPRNTRVLASTITYRDVNGNSANIGHDPSGYSSAYTAATRARKKTTWMARILGGIMVDASYAQV
jgi:hypothetical protein